MFRSVWDQIHSGMDIICLHRTGSYLNSIVPHGITFISGPIWYQRADLIHTGSTWSHVNIRLTNTNFMLVPKGSSPCKCCLNTFVKECLGKNFSFFVKMAFFSFYSIYIVFWLEFEISASELTPVPNFSSIGQKIRELEF